MERQTEENTCQLNFYQIGYVWDLNYWPNGIRSSISQEHRKYGTITVISGLEGKKLIKPKQFLSFLLIGYT